MRLSAIVVLMSFSLVSCQTGVTSKEDLKTQKDKVSYSIGLDIGKNMKTNSIEVDSEILLQGLKDGLEGKDGLLTEEEIAQVMQEFQQELMAKQAAKQKEDGEKNMKEGAEFLEANKKKEGVKVLPSGLQYKVIKSGDGPSPKETDKVKTHYKGTLINGTEFDNSYSRGEPAVFPVNGVIKGWTEVLQLMKVGDKWEVYIPADLAYGERGAGGTIPPNATLIFEVELLGIEK
ncbi:MAG TPA: FKBP-type peptidyl-prolyl cis-trans isomerase [Ignavibacteriaceae bacterium]|nr:FKBP-type peptidyl-prolyl cis-trans isomerase [Ignavibacteriaceae bacterium]